MKQHAWFLLLLLLLVLPPPAATAQEFLLYEDFEEIAPPALPAGWTTLDANGDLASWETKSFGGVRIIAGTSSPNCIRYPGAPVPADDWCFSSEMNIEPAVPYTLAFWYRTVTTIVPQRLSVYLATSQSPADTVLKIWTNESLADTDYTIATASFLAPSTGVFYLAFHCYSDPGSQRLYVDDISVTAPVNGLELKLKTVEDQASYSHGGEINTVTFLKNIRPAAVTVNGLLTTGQPNDKEITLAFIIVNPSGDTLLYKAHYDAPEPGSADFKSLATGEYVFKFVDVNRGGFDFSAPGAYQVAVMYTNYFTGSDPAVTVWRGRIVSNTITLTVE